MTLAPCIAILGPPNSGKTTLLHLVDAALTAHPDEPLAYVVKGNPDGTGRYLHHAPDLREAFKPLVKGHWTRQTPETIRDWVRRARRSLELVLLDFGGKHDAANLTMLAECSHYLVLARRFDDSAKEGAEGMESWASEAEAAGLEAVARIESLWETGEAALDSGSRRGVFRADAGRPGDERNRDLVEPLVSRLMELRVRREEPPYFNLQRAERWSPGDLATLGGRRAALEEAVRRDGFVNLGGKTAIYVFLAAMHQALDARPDASISLFDPKLPGAFLPVPAGFHPTQPGFPPDELRLAWSRSGDTARLDLSLLATDKFLSIEVALNLHAIPVPAEADPRGLAVTVNGPGPAWLHAACSRDGRGRAGRGR